LCGQGDQPGEGQQPPGDADGHLGPRADLPGAGSTPLTAREADVLREAEHGLPTEQIAVRLSLSPAGSELSATQVRQDRRTLLKMIAWPPRRGRSIQ
jgi:Bacterial regulatory proteins, luxR family